ncbi:hypothetical protein B7494_g8344 [Chlorociboria aeruginascens]|nr:hypothetical protein B7494_g8344 [Chlorociboria aeruginascens]
MMATLSLYIFTFNCGRSLIDVEAVASQLFNGLSTPHLPDILFLSLQEIAPIPHSLIGGSFLVPYFARFHIAVRKASKKANAGQAVYKAVSARHIGMTGMMVFARDLTAVQDLETAEIGVGLWEMGNKGAVGVRFSYHDMGASTEITLVAAHLAAMEEELKRRNQDWKNIVRGLVFSSRRNENATSLSADTDADDQALLSISPQDASIYKPTSYLFLAGDLNYRTSLFPPGPNDPIDTFPQPSQHRSSKKHYANLFSSDQLNQERLAGRTCHGLIEAPVTFPPTYKYKPYPPFLTADEHLSHWPWAKHRWPSWCDRILYLDLPSWFKRDHPELTITAHKYSALPLFPTSDHRAVTLDVAIPLTQIPRPEGEETDDPRVHLPFAIDVNWKAKRDSARSREVIVGFLMYFTTTLEGGIVVIAVAAGALGGFYVLRALIGL